MRTSIVNIMANLSKSNFKLKNPSFEDFDLMEIEEKSVIDDSIEDFSSNIDIWAIISVEYEGEPPESYKVLNKIIQDWVEENEEDLKNLIGPYLIKFLKDRYPNIDVSELEEDFGDFIWEDQVDYMPDIDEENKKITFIIELIIEVEDVEEEEDL